jgi:CRISPR-associated endonuclease/helicase Cas3
MEAYPYQKRLANFILSEGRNVILQAPTGAGKTYGALLPYINALENQHDFPSKCVYSVPMRILATQFVHEWKSAVKRAAREDRIKVAIQTGDQSDDPTFSSDLIFATIDQTLSSFLLAPYSLPRRQANLNLGAIAGSYLVFDEFHLYDPDSTLPTTLAMLKTLNGIAPFVLMTATYSRHMLETLAHELKAVAVPTDDAERGAMQNLASQQNDRYYRVAAEPLSARTVLDHHSGRSLVICNTVDRARRLYEALLQSKPANREVLLLHSRFLPEDRHETETLIRDVFGEGKEGGDYIVVSTQAIEVGLNITSTAMHTELAPANAIIQRAGRCARYKGDTGTVHIYSTVQDGEEVIDLLEDPMPYQGQKEVFARTLEAFRAHDGQRPLTFADEQDIIDAAHHEQDQGIINMLQTGHFGHQQRVYAVQRGDQRDDPCHLIREVASQPVTIHTNPDELLEAPFDVQSFGLHPYTVFGYVKDWLKRASELNLEWAVQWLHEFPTETDHQANLTEYEWIDWRQDEKIWGAPLIVVNKALATYDPKLGFLADRGGEWQASLQERKARKGDWGGGYRLETYAEHIRLVHEAFVERWSEMAHTARTLETRFGWPQGSIRRAAELAVLLHDVGKLSVGWQNWVQKYQTLIGRAADAAKAYAHTDYQYGNAAHDEAQRAAGKRPWHAVEGAWAVAPIFDRECEPPLARAALSAIARHHAPYSDSHQPFRLKKYARQHIAHTLENAGLPVLDLSGMFGADAALTDNGDFKELIALPDEVDVYLPYALIARALRLADQIGTQRGSISLSK